MGCDIHLYIEKRIGRDSEWVADEGHTVELGQKGTPDEYEWVNSCTATGRDYNLFGILADVRGSGNIYPQRGLPPDLSEVVAKAVKCWNAGGHSHSYLDLQEFVHCLEEADYYRKGEINRSHDAFYDWGNMGYRNRPDGYTTVVNHCNKWIDDHRVDNILLETKHEPEVRLVFWFDN